MCIFFSIHNQSEPNPWFAKNRNLQINLVDENDIISFDQGVPQSNDVTIQFKKKANMGQMREREREF